MKLKWMLVVLASLLLVSAGRTQDQKPQLPKGQMPDLGRPTKVGDELPPFTYNGATIRIRHAMRLLSPFNDNVATTVSANGGPFRNYGNPWWRKGTTATE
jgi:hypothetical protein